MSVALGIDFEDLTHTPAYRSLDAPDLTGIDLHRVTGELLELFDENGVNVTFFVVAQIAREEPDLIRRIERAGHEIASHTTTHSGLTDCSGERRRREIEESKTLLEDVVDGPVVGFRAPTCKIDDSVYSELLEANYRYSSSVMPPVPIPGFYSNEYDFESPTEVHDGTDHLLEVPLSLSPYVRLPLSGAWIRMLGAQYLYRSVRWLTERGSNVVTYSHPWEFVSQRGTTLPFRCRVRTGDWLFETYERLLKLDVEFCTVGDLAAEVTTARRYAVTR